MKTTLLPCLLLIFLAGCFAVNAKRKQSQELNSTIEQLTNLQVVSILQQDSLDRNKNLLTDTAFISRRFIVRNNIYALNSKVAALTMELKGKEKGNENEMSSGN